MCIYFQPGYLLGNLNVINSTSYKHKKHFKKRKIVNATMSANTVAAGVAERKRQAYASSKTSSGSSEEKHQAYLVPPSAQRPRLSYDSDSSLDKELAQMPLASEFHIKRPDTDSEKQPSRGAMVLSNYSLRVGMFDGPDWVKAGVLTTTEETHVPVAEETEEEAECQYGEQPIFAERRLVRPIAPVVDKYFGTGLSALCVGKLSNAGDLWEHIDQADWQLGQRLSGAQASARPHAIVGLLRCVTEGATSAVNNVGQSKFVRVGKDKRFNTKFWENHMQYRGGQSSNKVWWMNLGLKIPAWCVNDIDLEAHRTGLNVAAELKSVVRSANQDVLPLKVWGIYASVLCKMLNHPLTQCAEFNGFEPVFLFKNVHWHQNRITGLYELQTINRGACTSVYLIGYTRYKREDPSQYELLPLTDSDGLFAMDRKLDHREVTTIT